MSKKIFINYRKGQGKLEAEHLYLALRKRFSKSRLFMDVTHLEGGQAWLEAIEGHVAESFAMVALIGEDWLQMKDAQGVPRLSGESDPVRFEIATALRKRVPVIPVLLGDAKLPNELDLPRDMRGMLNWQAMPLRIASFDEDSSKLADALAKHLPKRVIRPSVAVAGIAMGVITGLAGGASTAMLLYPYKDAGQQIANPELVHKSELLNVETRIRTEEQVKVDLATKSANEKAALLRERDRELTRLRSTLASGNASAEREAKWRSEAENSKAEIQRLGKELDVVRRKADNDAKTLAAREAALEQRDRDLAALRATQRSKLAINTPHDAIRAVQQRLHELGYYNGALDGIAGNRLYRAMTAAFVAQGSSSGQDNEIVSRFRELVSKSSQSESAGGLVAMATNLVDRTNIQQASAVQRPAYEDLAVTYNTREAPRDGSFPPDSDIAQYKMNLSGGAFDRLVVLDNALNLHQVELCKVPCADAERGQKWSVTREEANQLYGGKYIFRMDDGRVKTAPTAKASDGYPDFDDTMYLRLMQRKGMPKSFAVSLVYRRQ